MGPFVDQWSNLKANCVFLTTSGEQVATLDCIPAVMVNIIDALIIFVGVVCLAIIIGSGYKYMNAGGDPKKLDSARNTLVHAIAGLLVVLFSFLIRDLIADVTGVPCVKTFGFGCNP